MASDLLGACEGPAVAVFPGDDETLPVARGGAPLMLPLLVAGGRLGEAHGQ